MQLSDAVAVGRWALGSMNVIATPVQGIWHGRSLFDGSDCFFEIRAHHEHGLVDYHVGSMALRLPRVSIRVTPGETRGMEHDDCTAAMTTWRAAGLDHEGWLRTCRAHDVEVLLFKAQIETAWNSTR